MTRAAERIEMTRPPSLALRRAIIGDNISTAWLTPANASRFNRGLDRLSAHSCTASRRHVFSCGSRKPSTKPFNQAHQAGVEIGRGQRLLHALPLHGVPLGGDRHHDFGLALKYP